MAQKKVTGVQTENLNKEKKDRVNGVMRLVHFVFLIMSVAIIGRVIYIQTIYKVDPDYRRAFTPRAKKNITDPTRGSILAKDGRLLAVSVPMYQIYMDCSVQKDYYEDMGERGKTKNREWLDKARNLSDSLALVFGDMSGSQYYKLIASGRANNRRYVKIGRPIDHATLLRIKEFPLFRQPSHEGGLIVEKMDTRHYPYGALARRTIGSVRNNSDRNSHIGLEGKYDYVLHGTEGLEWMQKSDAHGWIRDYDSTIVKVRDGLDIRTTIDIDIQDIADKALKELIMKEEKIESGCAVVMEVATGAVRAMVNLTSSSGGVPAEEYNYAIGRACNPGSVFKLATLMTLLEDGKIKSLETMVPTHKGVWKYGTGKNTMVFRDEYLQRRNVDEISVIDGFKISSNNVFRQLACQYYEDNPKRYTDKLSEYKFTEAFDFDIAGLATPVVVTPDQKGWSGTALPSIAIGYTVLETPLHIVTFYNAVAAKGKMMKPYLVESFEQNGTVKKKLGPEILNGSICSKATADTLLRALKAVVQDGTGSGLKNAKCQVAGKTGTAQLAFKGMKNGREQVVFVDDNNFRQHQATFVGFFPADDPKYTAIVVLYSKKGNHNLYGSTAVPVFKTIVDDIYALDDSLWGESIRESGSMPQKKTSWTEAADYAIDEIPNVKGMGLNEAIYTIENCGYKCSFEGIGHVASQSPSPGVKAKKGDTVSIKLK